MTQVFISYSHDSDEHRTFVRELSDRLRREGLDCLIDQYVNGFPPEGWQRWMENQIEAADFVLLVCTETYLRRYRGLETEGGKGVTLEGVVISQDLYDAYNYNTKFIPVIPANGDLNNVPTPLKAFNTYRLPEQYGDLYRYLTTQPKHVAPPVGKIQSMPEVPSQITTSRIHSDRLPTVKGGFFGREDELELLDNVWSKSPLSPLFQSGGPSRQGVDSAGGPPTLFQTFRSSNVASGERGGFNTTHIIQFIAPGGTGKTKLLRHWLDRTSDIDALLAWSFYSQGAGEDKQISATPFFSHAFAKLGSTRTDFATEEDKGEHLAELLREQRCVLVLDGLEPLQHAGRGMQGELKDRAIRQLLKSLAGQNNGLCIVTTRIAVHELCDRAHVISHDLENLSVDDGVLLLQSLKVTGNPTELTKAVQEYGCHALALSLLGNVLRLRYQSDVLKRDTLKELPVKAKGNQTSRHAFKVMQAYEEWFAAESAHSPELALLKLLGLFDHPIELEVLRVLWEARIPQLTTDIAEDEWLEAVDALREEHHLLAQHEGSNDLDCHPLIREYFGQQLRDTQPEAWQQAHEVLYEYYKALPEKELPDTLEEMQPLFSAVAHGCAAGLHQQALDEVYRPRIRRKGETYILKVLGAFGDDLALIAHFFTTPWQAPVMGLSKYWQTTVLNWAIFRLRALGRLREAMEPAQVGVEGSVEAGKWRSAAINIDNLSKLNLILGEVAQAKSNGQLSVEYADLSGKLYHRLSKRANYANALHQSGEVTSALTLFREAEQLQQEYQPEHSMFFGLRCFRYCDLLLAQGRKEYFPIQK